MSGQRRRKAPRAPLHRRIATGIIPAAGLGAIAVAGFSAVTAQPLDSAQTAVVPSEKASVDIIAEARAGRSDEQVTRSIEREALPAPSDDGLRVKGKKFVLDDVEVRAAAGKQAPVLASLEEGDQVQVTGARSGGWAEVIHNDMPRWVPAKQLVNEMPEPEPTEVELSAAPCALGSGIESGLQPDTVKVYRTVCARYPSISSYGGIAGRGEHATGHSLDIMVSGPLGWEIAEFLRANRVRLGISYLIYEQKIWTVQRNGEGWRPMSNRGGRTANHFDHVHVTTYGNAATS